MTVQDDLRKMAEEMAEITARNLDKSAIAAVEEFNKNKPKVGAFEKSLEVKKVNLQEMRNVLSKDAERDWQRNLCHSIHCPAYNSDRPHLAATYDSCTCDADINRALDDTLQFLDGQEVTYEHLVGELQKRYNMNHKKFKMLNDAAERRIESLFMHGFIDRTGNKGEFDEPLYIVKAPNHPCRVKSVEVNTMINQEERNRISPDVNPELRNESENSFINIGSEKWREYTFKDGRIERIDFPLYLSVSKSGGHRILDRNEVCHYIPGGWIHLKWKVFPGEPHFVK